mgnify:CR=1 FL=1
MAGEAQGRMDFFDRQWRSYRAIVDHDLMEHRAVAEAGVIGKPDDERGMIVKAFVVLKPGRQASGDELRQHLAPGFAKWWLPDRIEFVDEIPRTSTGKFLKTALRERFR